MADQVFYTKKRNAQWRGPTTSDDFNERIEENYRDLTVLGNKQQSLWEELEYLKRLIAKGFNNTQSAVGFLSSGILNIEAAPNARFVGLNLDIDNDNFIGTEYEINDVDQLTYDERYRLLTLPYIESGSFSKLKFISMDGREIVSPNLKVFVDPVGGAEQQPENLIDANDFYNALISNTTHRGWELNSVVDGAYEGISTVRVYVTIPDDQSLVRESNTILFDPLYSGTENLANFQYTTARNVTFTSADNWQDFSVGQYPLIVDNRHVLPDSGDEIEGVVSTHFAFPPKPITGIRFDMSTQRFMDDTSLNVYSHGLAGFDIRYNKYASTGKVLLRIDAGDETISSIDSVTPVVANCNSSEVPFAFSWRAIWETSEDSGVYTLEPVPLSSKVWIEVTLRKTVDGGAPTIPFLYVETS
jgi:hypothetical protein